MKQRYFPTFNQYLNEQEVNEAIFDPALLQEFNKLVDDITAIYKQVYKHQKVKGKIGQHPKYNAEIIPDEDGHEYFFVSGDSISKVYSDLIFFFYERSEHRTKGQFQPGKRIIKNAVKIFDCVLVGDIIFDVNTFRHEMIHYKDYLRNNYKFAKSHSHLIDQNKYFSTPHEFLAHTQENMMAFADMFTSLPNGVPDTIEEFMKLLDTHKELSRDDIFDKKYRKKYRKNIYKLWKELKNNAMAYKLIFNIVKGKLPTDMDTSKLIKAIKQIQDNDSEFIINWKRKHFKRTLSKLKKAHDNGDFFDFNDDSDELDIVLQQAR